MKARMPKGKAKWQQVYTCIETSLAQRITPYLMNLLLILE